ncbi:MFS transporter [Burkholderia cenocepacia]|uniref:MFS transporter n=1 Tax=Burkholderia cenocepacia TaxID=95486 RepID=UPI0022301518|nr:MFS transporter [Burkholderia cenocepacia]MCW3604732.1 MFS transporter [Burkholderia cenocepacia]MCW5186056.1 MFS transporter [Burkholderia cenocepacia]
MKPPTASPPAPHPFTPRLAIGLVGVLIAALSSGLNDRVTDIALVDLRGILGMGHDEGTWIAAVYEAAEVSAMMISAWFAVTLSFRRFAIGVTLAFAGFAVVFPFVRDYPLLVGLRIAQGILGGALPPLLMTAALRFLPPGIKLYGMSAYALTATFGPNLAMPLAALWTDKVGWQFVYWQVIPPCAIAATMIGYGLPQDPVRLERFRQFDWIGVLTGCGGISMVVLALEQGERLDWFHSSLICTLLLAGSVLLAIFVVNEWHHPLPLFKLQILGRRNFAHGLLTLAGLLIVFSSGSTLPSLYLMEVRDFRPLEIGPLALAIAIPQLVAAPFAAMLCNIRQLDSRFVLATGLGLIAGSCVLGSFLTSVWGRDSFFVLQAMQALGQPMAVLPVLMGATGAVQPPEGPFASAMFNTTRGIATVIGTALVETFMTHRRHFHSNMILDHVGGSPHLLSQASDSIGRHAAPLLPDGTPRSTDAIAQFAALVREQVFVMSVADTYLLMMGVAFALILLMLVLPQRAYPPRPATAPGPGAVPVQATVQSSK